MSDEKKLTTQLIQQFTNISVEQAEPKVESDLFLLKLIDEVVIGFPFHELTLPPPAETGRIFPLFHKLSSKTCFKHKLQLM